ncbi:hypothetical protein PSENEW3_00004026, partial [Picochlorum sp. SENEW3]
FIAGLIRDTDPRPIPKFESYERYFYYHYSESNERSTIIIGWGAGGCMVMYLVAVPVMQPAGASQQAWLGGMLMSRSGANHSMNALLMEEGSIRIALLD